MNFLKEWFMSVTGVIILSTLAEGIMPSGNVRKYVRILFGLILIIFVCRPFVKGEILDIDTEAVCCGETINLENSEKKESENVLRLYKANLAKQIIGSLKGISSECEWEVKTDIETRSMESFGAIKAVIITVKTDDKNLNVSDETEELISSLYGVSKKNIAIKYSGK